MLCLAGCVSKVAKLAIKLYTPMNMHTLSVYVYVYVYVCMYAYIYIYTLMHVCICIYNIYIYLYVSIYTYFLCKYIRRPRLQQGERVREEITSSKEQQGAKRDYRQQGPRSKKQGEGAVSSFGSRAFRSVAAGKRKRQLATCPFRKQR